MPIPNYNRKMPWVPPEWQDVYAEHTYYGAWYSGDPRLLHAVHESMIGPAPQNSFWSKRVDDEEYQKKLHVPMAADIAAASADLLFSEVPDATIPEAENAASGGAIEAQERLIDIMQQGDMYSRLLEAAETSAALGGVYLKPVWDINLAPFPILSIVQADLAIPEFKWGILTAVTFWRVLSVDKDTVWRHLERHERGHIYHALYKGTMRELGDRRALIAHPETKDLLDEEQTQINDLLVRYIPNIKPNRTHRGSALGRSDYAGIESLMDSLDETYSSWIRDIRLGRARILVPVDFLEYDPEGRTGPRFDIDKTVFTPLGVDPLSMQNATSPITPSQFAIRTAEHKETALELIERIIGHAGYSPQTFGLKVEGSAESGRSLDIRERRSWITKTKKERYWTSALEDILELMLAIDRIHLGGTHEILRPKVTIADAQGRDIGQIAQTVQLMAAAQAASIDTRVRMLHPDWSEEQIQAEVALIREEEGIGQTAVNPEDFNLVG